MRGYIVIWLFDCLTGRLSTCHTIIVRLLNKVLNGWTSSYVHTGFKPSLQPSDLCYELLGITIKMMCYSQHIFQFSNWLFLHVHKKIHAYYLYRRLYGETFWIWYLVVFLQAHFWSRGTSYFEIGSIHSRKKRWHPSHSDPPTSNCHTGTSLWTPWNAVVAWNIGITNCFV